VVAIGNTLAGDDGVGVEVVRRLQRLWSDRPEVLFEILPGDLLAVSELLDRAERFLFVDALSGERPGSVEVRTAAPRAFSPSLHQTDIGAVMATLERLGVVDPFPPWEVWGVVIEPPRELREGLSPEVEAGAAELAEHLHRHLDLMLGRPRDLSFPID
jgi:hydrogenase maturation protease